MHCSLFDAKKQKKTLKIDTTNQILLGQELAESSCASHLKVEIPTAKTAIHPWITEMLNKGHGKFPPPSKKAAE